MRLIDADALKDYMRKGLEDTRRLFKDNGALAEIVTNGFCDDIDEQPTIEPERNRGEWVDINGKAVNPAGYAAYCSVCGEWSEYLTPFCGWCGAEMAGYEEEVENECEN